MPAPESVSRLTKQFREHLDAYKSGKYNETQLRREFLDPFFVELGWDVFYTQGYAGDYKDVVHEAAIKIGGTTKAPDYSFRIGGQRKFFVEAKKPSVDVKGDPHPAYQLRRYAWTAGLPVSILSDFEEFAVYDCRVKPTPRDKASTARILYMTFEEYEERWEEIEGIFSKTAILKGAFDKYASKQTRKRGTAEPDEEFLKLLEGWRADLAQNIARNNTLTVRQINHAVQLIIDRIVFLRICEDRGVEVAGTLQALVNGSKVYERLFERFRHADAKYNSGLFHFEKEAGREAPDTLTPSLDVGDKILKDIIRNLYYPESPYELSVLPADILGNIYERFLGSVITLSKTGKTANVEEKPEVRKAGGVYYTPTYIVDYIVEHTVGELLKDRDLELKGRGKSRSPVMNKPLRVLDPACGSGSFLLGAYDHLLEWHLRYYTDNDPESWAKLASPPIARKAIPDEKATHSDYKLTTHEKKRILTEHIYGVDIDAQAVEVTKLSLLLKVLEGENEETLQPLLFAKERALPDLSDNIRCGNSLIGSDFYAGQQGTMFDEEEQYRINAFDWEVAFKEIMESGGFEAVIGNPPYVDIKALPEPEVRYVFDRYPCSNNRVNLFATFIEQSLRLVHQRGFRFSMIVPTALLSQKSYKDLRRMILDVFTPVRIARLPNESFGAAAGDVKVDTAITVVGPRATQSEVDVVAHAGYERIDRISEDTADVAGTVAIDRWRAASENVWSLAVTEADCCVLARCEESSIELGEIVEICLGLTPYDKYKGHTKSQISERVFHADNQKDETFRPLLAGNDVMRYRVQWNGKHWISYGPWLGAPREPRFFRNKRILVKQIIDWTTRRIWAGLTEDELYNTQNAFNLLPANDYSLEYILGLLNSKLMTYYHRKRFLDEFKMRFQKILIRDCRRFPIAKIDRERSKDVAMHDRMVELVQSMLDMNERLHGEAGDKLTPQERRVLESRIASTDREIDRLVYDLYGLTDEEVAIVEQATQV